MATQPPHPPETRRRRTAVMVSGMLVLLVFLALESENVFTFRFLHPHGSAQIVVFVAVSLLAFLLLLALLLLLLRNIIKLYLTDQSRVLGARLRTRMVAGALLLSFAPVTAMLLFSYVLMNRSIDRWFSTPVTGLRDQADQLAQQLTSYVKDNAHAEAESIAGDARLVQELQPQPGATAHKTQRTPAPSIDQVLRTHRSTLQGGFAVVYHGPETVAAFQLPLAAGNIVSRTAHSDQVVGDATSNLPALLLRNSITAPDAVLSVPTSGTPSGETFVTDIVPVTGGGTVLVGLPVPESLPVSIASIQQGTRDYLLLSRQRRGIRTTFLLILVTLSVAVLFGASWLALTLSKQITRPIETLADAMAEIAAGRYRHRIAQFSGNELERLFDSFNHMAADLESSRDRLDASSQQLTLANRSLEARRVEIETILDTIPLAVLGLEPGGRVLHSNAAFHSLIGLRPPDAQDITGAELRQVLPQVLLPQVERLMRRSDRMGIATKEVEYHSAQGILHLSVVVASMRYRGHILVFEDATELLRAQKQAAWKEVAQRVAHEIKNPLTPIGLNAEIIARYVDRDTLAANSGKVRESARTIATAVDTMRSLVDQFSLLAQFPSVAPVPCDLNLIVENTLRLFAGRISEVKTTLRLAPEAPFVLADANAVQRALANLVENAAEAMQGQLLRQLTISTGMNESNTMAEIIVADTGHGLTDEDREQIFLPWFSTKQRGTGLGLSIVAQVVQQHNGSIRAEKNSPVGTRFILELPLAERSRDETPQLAAASA